MMLMALSAVSTHSSVPPVSVPQARADPLQVVDVGVFPAESAGV